MKPTRTRRWFAAVALVLALTPFGADLMTDTAAVAAPVRLPRGTWSECVAGRNVLEGPYWTGRRWLVDVRRYRAWRYREFTVDCTGRTR